MIVKKKATTPSFFSLSYSPTPEYENNLHLLWNAFMTNLFVKFSAFATRTKFPLLWQNNSIPIFCAVSLKLSSFFAIRYFPRHSKEFRHNEISIPILICIVDEFNNCILPQVVQHKIEYVNEINRRKPPNEV